MTNSDRNIRTLIICFVLAMMCLVPLRISEENNLSRNEVKVLGEKTEKIVFEEKDNLEKEIENIILPDAGNN
jgi:hypothetical protein